MSKVVMNDTIQQGYILPKMHFNAHSMYNIDMKLKIVNNYGDQFISCYY